MKRLSRRRFLVGAGTASLTLGASAGWADAGSPRFLAAGKDPSGYKLMGLGPDGTLRFEISLPSRGHAAAAHPERAEAVAFARRPGTYAVVIDCVTGHVRHRLEAEPGRHFFGHGVYSRDGAILFTTENAYTTGDGRLGLWDASADYRRIGEISSGGIGPHDVVRLPGSEILAIANGGIRTHPASGRDKLNLGSMRPNLTYMDAATGAVIDQVEPDDALRLNSIRHLAVSRDGRIAAATQWQGDPQDGVPLIAFHRLAEPYQANALVLSSYVSATSRTNSSFSSFLRRS
ncbi:MAG: DUF1513 domain-containing protein, partial [Pseudomonadota bacterium]